MSSSTAAAGPDWRAFDLFEFARAGRSGAGDIALGDLPRIVNELAVPVSEHGGSRDGFVHWTAQGERREVTGAAPELHLHVTIRAALWLECQRCMTPYEQPIHVRASYLIVATEEQADAVPLEDDEIDPIVGSKQFDLYELIEEEILLSFPLVPKHDVCPSVHESLVTGKAGDIVIAHPDPDEAKRDDNPFAALSALKRDVPPKNDA
ncbi:YceD family protein [Pararobbsia silviterrae]|uniref:Large ribosomal RNA subunit accumulation protein YceD n=1 Tax=Pararobbsia silviterrae TaxID=1792498 RepID=A0A494Y126_9BURK|nr:YceD family protein [Pararobbsia silviterrae]RKP56462.1 DUF177 domain-containing protein [Pararobbsia silviterrae]